MNYIADCISSNVNYYFQSQPKLSPAEELGQFIEKTFGDTVTSQVMEKEAVSELSVLAEAISIVRKCREEKPIGFAEQMKKAKEMHFREHENNKVQLSKSASLSLFKEREEIDSAAKIAVLNKLHAFAQEHIVLIRTVKQSTDVSYQKTLSKQVFDAIAGLIQLDLERIREDKLSGVAEDFKVVEDDLSQLHITPPEESSFSASSFSSGVDTEIKGDTSALKAVGDVQELDPTVSKTVDNLRERIADDYVPAHAFLRCQINYNVL